MERLTFRKIATATAMSIGLVACGDDGGATNSARIEPSSSTSNKTPFQVEAIIYPNGTRRLRYSREAYLTDRYQHCDGYDLVEQSNRLGNAGYDIVRIANHPACADLTLTREDFPLAGK